MNAYLRPLVSCRLYTTLIRLRKKDFGEIEKIKHTVKRMFTLELCIALFVCVHRLYLLCVVVHVIITVCLCA